MGTVGGTMIATSQTEENAFDSDVDLVEALPSMSPEDAARSIGTCFEAGLRAVTRQAELLQSLSECGTPAIGCIDSVIEAYYGDRVESPNLARTECEHFVDFIELLDSDVLQAVARTLRDRIASQKKLTAIGHLAAALRKVLARGAFVSNPPLEKLEKFRGSMAELLSDESRMETLLQEEPDVPAATDAGSLPDEKSTQERFQVVIGITLDELNSLVDELQPRHDRPISDLFLKAVTRDASALQTSLAGGDDVGEADEEGNSVLHAAAIGGSLECCRILMDAGIPPTEPNHAGRTPVEVALMAMQARAESVHDKLGSSMGAFALRRYQAASADLFRLFSDRGARQPCNLSSREWDQLLHVEPVPLLPPAPTLPSSREDLSIPGVSPVEDTVDGHGPGGMIKSFVIPALLLVVGLGGLVFLAVAINSGPGPLEGNWSTEDGTFAVSIQGRTIHSLVDDRTSAFEKPVFDRYRFEDFPPFTGMKHDEEEDTLSFYRTGRNKRNQAWNAVDHVLRRVQERGE